MGNKVMNVFTYPTLTNLLSIIKKSNEQAPFQVMKAYRWCTGIALLILTLMLSGGEWSTSCPSHFIPRNEPQYPSGGPQRKNLLPLPEFQIFIAQCMAQSLRQLSS